MGHTMSLRLYNIAVMGAAMLVLLTFFHRRGLLSRYASSFRSAQAVVPTSRHECCPQFSRTTPASRS